MSPALLRNRLKTLAETPGTRVHDRDVISALRVHDILPADQVDHALVVDCRQFKDPERDREASPHLGLHPRVQEGLLADARFPGWVSSLHARFYHDVRGQRAARPDLSPHVTLIFWCNHGRHRSVAACQLVRNMVEGSLTLKVHGRVRHLGHWNCGSTCNCCRTCLGEGLGDWRDRQFYRMRDMWARSNVEEVE